MSSDSLIRYANHSRPPQSHTPTNIHRINNNNKTRHRQASFATNVPRLRRPAYVLNATSIIVMSASFVSMLPKSSPSIKMLIFRRRHSSSLTVCVNNTNNKNVNTIATSVGNICAMIVCRRTKTIQSEYQQSKIW